MNKELQLLAAGKGVRQWQIAKELGLAEETLCRLLRHELPKERRQQIIDAIEKLAEQNKSLVRSEYLVNAL